MGFNNKNWNTFERPVILIAFIIVFSVGPQCLVDGLIGSLCLTSSQCDVPNTYCKYVSPSCYVGSCVCQPGFVYVDSNVTGTRKCRRAAQLGEACNSSLVDICLFGNSNCTGGICQCATDYTLGPIEGTCVPTTAKSQFSGRCYDSTECYYGLQCINNFCVCAPGFKVTSNLLNCTERQLGDTCVDSDDCSQIAYGICSRGKCVCIPPTYNKTQYQESKGVSKYICAKSIVGEGKSCAIDQGIVCGIQFVCHACFPINGTRFCIRPVPTLLSSSPVLIHSSFSIVTMAGLMISGIGQILLQLSTRHY